MKKTLFATALFAFPLVAFAQSNLRDVLVNIAGLFNILIPILIAMAVVVFFWGLVKYIFSSGEGHSEGINIMIAGLVGIFIMVSLFGIIRLIGNTFGVWSGNNTFVAPSIQVQ